MFSGRSPLLFLLQPTFLGYGSSEWSVEVTQLLGSAGRPALRCSPEHRLLCPGLTQTY